MSFLLFHCCFSDTIWVCVFSRGREGHLPLHLTYVLEGKKRPGTENLIKHPIAFMICIF